jgi:hypothetical protein
MGGSNNNNMLPATWGPVAWSFIHSVTMGYPENPTKEDMNHYKNFFESLGYILPCEWCKEHYTKNLQNIPINSYLDSRRNLVYWGYKLHNLVNEQTGVPKSKWPSFESIYKEYDSMRSEVDCNTNKTCNDEGSSKRCKVQYIKENFQSMEDNVFCKYWWLITLVIILIIVIIIFIIKCSKLSK